MPRWVHRPLPRFAPPAAREALRSARVPPVDYLDKPIITGGQFLLSPGDQFRVSLDRVAERARATLKEARRMAAEVGFDATFTKIGKPTAGTPGKTFAPRGPARQKYRNPENPSETWAGRGRPPKWVQAALERGQSLEDLAIPEAPGDSAAAA